MEKKQSNKRYLKFKGSKEGQFLLKKILPSQVWGIIIFLIGGVTVYLFLFLTGFAFSWAIEPIRETRWYLLPPILGMGILFMILFRKVVEQRIQVLELMLLFAGIVLLMFILQLIDYSHKGAGIYHRAEGGLLINFSDALLPLAVISFYLHLELSSRDYPNVINSVVIIGSAAPLSILVAIKPFAKSFIRIIELTDLIHAYQIAFSIGTLLMGFYGIYMFYKVFKEADTLTAEFASILNEIGALMILVSFVISPLGDYFYTVNLKINIYNTWLFTAGIMIILFVYVIIPTYAYAFPFNVYEIFVVDNGGSTFYHKLIEIPVGVQKIPDATLKSPAIVAIASLVSELAGAKGKLKTIVMTDRVILVNVRNNVVGILLADRTSFFLKRGFEKFIEEFVDRFSVEIEEYSGNVTVFKSADELLQRIFPFVK